MSQTRVGRTNIGGEDKGSTEATQGDTGGKVDVKDSSKEGVNNDEPKRDINNGKLKGEHGSNQEAEDEGDSAFGQLVLPEGHKKMVKSLVAQHFRDKESQEERQADIISGKGENTFMVVDNRSSLHYRKGSNHSLTWRSWSWEDNYSW